MGKGPRLTTLDNGIRVLSDTMPGLESISINSSFAVGSCYENLAEHGVAHFLEHMVFKGTSQRTAEQIQNEINRYGGFINASTDWDTTHYTCHILNEGADTALNVIADMVVSPLLTTADIDVERDVILQELRSRNGSRSVLVEGFYEAAFGDQSLARPIIGSEENLEAIDATMLRDFHQRFYTTGNLIVSISGGIDHDQAVGLVAKAFAKVPFGAEAARPTAEYYGGEVQFACSCDCGMVMFGFRAPPITERRGTAISLFRDILGEGSNSRLFRELREKRGLVYDTSAQTNFHIRHPMLILSAEGHAKNVKDMFLLMYDEVYDAASNITEAELETAKTGMISALRMNRDYVCQRSSLAVFDQTEIGRTSSLLDDINIIRGIDLEFLKACAQELVATTPTLAAHGPVRHLPKMKHVADRASKLRAA